ncbi:MAG: hypothetical protein US60_C0006G0020 [Microgenomates group bacterium GW2011_GWC1_37_8]|uniref:Uncharacterized protein n=1 Tax=Candidatus Woesebacteria bacterium GW2011_GWB1_38_8 TaxID=1618570 RepID=A0A0G0KZK7_9BACT|nr:MAG: hypothetical protein US60_C0006G0020 [Microgenomates group bacterium GW2011_GWC1_37_8]KKQ85093.1 MAG: hypothetical protein UT08_C0010G0020 [Candidatus Woesebacteria bacterium GW2011_GWB1_38_8]
MIEREIEPKPIVCIYCEDYAQIPAVENIKTIDGKWEPVCNMHGTWANAVGLVSNGYVQPEFVDLADYMRDVINDNTLRHFEEISIKDYGL